MSKIYQLTEWSKEGHLRILVSGVIVGQNLSMRFCNVISQESVNIGCFNVSKNFDVYNILGSLGNALQEAVSDVEIIGCAIAANGSIRGEAMIVKDWPGKIIDSTLTLPSLPSFICPINKSTFLTIPEAEAYGITCIDDNGDLNDNFEQLWPEMEPTTGPIVSNTRTAIFLLADHLEAAIINKNLNTEYPQIVEAKLSRIPVARILHNHPNFVSEDAAIKFMSEKLYGGAYAPEYGDFVSLNGLQILYEHFRASKGLPPPAALLNETQISNIASSDPSAEAALLLYYKMLVRAAKAVATSLCCESVVIISESVQRDKAFISSHIADLCDEFHEFIRPQWMSTIRLYIQATPSSFKEDGAAYMARLMQTRTQ